MFGSTKGRKLHGYAHARHLDAKNHATRHTHSRDGAATSPAAYLAVARRVGNTQLPQLHLDVLDAREEAVRQVCEVLVGQALALGWLCADQRPATRDQVRPPQVHVTVDEEELLRTHSDIQTAVTHLGVGG